MKEPVLATLTLASSGELVVSEEGIHVNFPHGVRLLPNIMTARVDGLDQEGYSRIAKVVQLALLKDACEQLEREVAKFAEPLADVTVSAGLFGGNDPEGKA